MKRENIEFNLNEKSMIEIKSLTKVYGTGNGSVHALNDINLTIQRGDFVVILGSSGSGKSTLLNMIGGIDIPTNGSITVEGVDICKLKNNALTLYRRDNVGFVFQSFNLLSDLTARENILLSASMSDNNQFVDEIMNSLGIAHCKNNYPSQMSGGEQQRTSIARALVKNCHFLLCDEPTGALDYLTGKQIVSELENLAKVKGMTVIFVTHTTSIASIANRVVKMRSGKIVEDYRNDNPLTVEDIEW